MEAIKGTGEQIDTSKPPVFTSLNGSARAFNPYISPDLLIFELLPDPLTPDYPEPIIKTEADNE